MLQVFLRSYVWLCINRKVKRTLRVFLRSYFWLCINRKVKRQILDCVVILLEALHDVEKLLLQKVLF